jgi:hypothetical protein
MTHNTSLRGQHSAPQIAPRNDLGGILHPHAQTVNQTFEHRGGAHREERAVYRPFPLPIGIAADPPILCLSALWRPVAVRQIVRADGGGLASTVRALCMLWILSYRVQCSLTVSDGAFMARAG